MKLSVQNIFFTLSTVALVIAGLMLAKSVFVPLVFALIIAMALTPLCNWFEGKGVGKILSIILVFLIVNISLVTIITIFSLTFADIYKELPEIQGEIDRGISTLEEKINDWTGASDEKIESEIKENQSRILSPLWKFVEGSISASFITIGNFFLVALYTILLLYYRKGIKAVLFKNQDEAGKKDLSELITEVLDVIKSYAQSMLIVIGILGIVNSIGLWIIGIDYPFFWGILAGLLVIIPYIGTTLGGILPFLYALATTDTIWQPVAIVIMYITVQQLEGNLITPNIVGSKVNVNAMTIIIAMIIGGLVWGLSGLILAMPVVAILRTVFVRYERSEKLGLLMSGNLGKK